MPQFLGLKIVLIVPIGLNRFKYNRLSLCANFRLRGTKVAEVDTAGRHVDVLVQMTTKLTRRQETEMRLSLRQIAFKDMTNEEGVAANSSQHLRHPMRCAIVITMVLSLCMIAHDANAASSDGCEGGGFTVLGRTSPQDASLPAAGLGSSFRVQGKYVSFDVDSATFGITNYQMTGAPNPRDITGGIPTPVFASKMPDHRGLVLTSNVDLELEGPDLVLMRQGVGLVMKIQAKDCAQGGIFQMEVERSDQSRTLFTHVLAPSAFYFDNPNFRAREGESLPYKDSTVTVSARINFANDASAKFVGRDSPQVADRVPHPSCTNQIRTSTGELVPVQHCGAVSQWLVASGGRMGQVMGEDAVEVAPPSTLCTHKCRAQNRVRGAAVVLGFPFQVPEQVRLKPRAP
ncbi:hypothetical protein [Noviherbaspirillum malthae]|uniref:hypothetical protein n=1 Tax=Noviherbaspirillum malthae TaxID=1260987 RepID=UPI001E2BF5CE|nr:hypothetical protein [Noviherbaspirillum malthae]